MHENEKVESSLVYEIRQEKIKIIIIKLKATLNIKTAISGSEMKGGMYHTLSLKISTSPEQIEKTLSRDLKEV